MPIDQPADPTARAAHYILIASWLPQLRGCPHCAGDVMLDVFSARNQTGEGAERVWVANVRCVARCCEHTSIHEEAHQAFGMLKVQWNRRPDSDAVAVLRDLVMAKKEKDDHGDTPVYRALKVGLWERAQAVAEKFKP